MHFNLYLDNVTGQRLSQLAQESGQSRNALIHQAISQWLEQQSKPKWPKAVMGFDGVGDVPAFESYRNDLLALNEDPFA